jgi:Tol biopolymer transport system component
MTKFTGVESEPAFPRLARSIHPGASPHCTKPAGYAYMRLSTDRRRIAFQRRRFWVYDWQRDTMTRLTFDARSLISRVWTPDGRIIVFSELPFMY